MGWHDDVIKWKKNSALLTLCAGNPPVTGEFPSQSPVTRSFDDFFDLRLNKRLSKQWWGWWFKTPSRPLWRHCNGITAMSLQRIPGFRWTSTTRAIWMSRNNENADLFFMFLQIYSVLKCQCMFVLIVKTSSCSTELLALCLYIYYDCQHKAMMKLFQSAQEIHTRIFVGLITYPCRRYQDPVFNINIAFPKIGISVIKFWRLLSAWLAPREGIWLGDYTDLLWWK